MRTVRALKKRRLLAALASGILLQGFYKLYLYTDNRAQFEDSNLLVSVGFILIATSFIFLMLELATISSSSK